MFVLENFNSDRNISSVFTTSGLQEIYCQVDSGGGGSAEVMVYSLGWGMGEPERRGAERKRAQPPAAAPATLSPEDDEVDVLPLYNQVGGHTRLLMLNENTVIKPLNIRELHFYQNIPEDMQNFVPRYKGVMQATNTGNNKLEKRYSPCFREESSHKKQALLGRRKRDEVIKFKVHRNGNASEVVKSIAHMDNTNKHYFLMLENVTWTYRRPCVMDLKMGTRQYTDDASAEKRSRQIAKCMSSTSAALGVRFCGMQVYVPETGVYLRRDKYWGRSLSETGLREALRVFFAGGSGVRARAVRRVMRELDLLRRAVAKQTNYRFYSCSLLIVYEGETPSLQLQTDDVPEVDEAAGSSAAGYDGDASSSSAECAVSPPTAPPRFDMSTLHEEITTDLSGKREPFQPHCEETMGGYENDEACGRSPRNNTLRAPSPASTDSWLAYSSTSSESWRGENDADSGDESGTKRLRVKEDAYKARRNQSVQPPPHEEHVDIRMIDFAHIVVSGAGAESPLATDTPHHGPDCGLLTGIDSLKRLLGEILLPQPFS